VGVVVLCLFFLMIISVPITIIGVLEFFFRFSMWKIDRGFDRRPGDQVRTTGVDFLPRVQDLPFPGEGETITFDEWFSSPTSVPRGSLYREKISGMVVKKSFLVRFNSSSDTMRIVRVVTPSGVFWVPHHTLEHTIPPDLSLREFIRDRGYLRR